MKNLQLGDKVICVKDFHRDNKLSFLAQRVYYIREFENYKSYDLVKIDNTWFTFDPISDMQFSVYFKTLGEYRDLRIDEIFSE